MKKIQPRSFPALPVGVTLKDVDSGNKGRLVIRAEGDRAIISVFDTIEAGFSGQITEALQQIGPKPVLVRVNSRGGDMFESLGGMSALLQHPASVHVEITALAASGASLLAMAGEQIAIVPSGTVMVHNAQGVVMGDHRMMTEAAKIFEGFSATVRSVYADRTGLDEKAVTELMNEGAWMNADQAKKLGFVDVITDQAPADDAAKRRRDLKASLRAQGYTRSQARRAVTALYGADADDEDELDLDAVAATLKTQFAAIEPYL
jgi:ATP-dependent protease ClpP protease subunit